jgi:hypothetical protein
LKYDLKFVNKKDFKTEFKRLDEALEEADQANQILNKASNKQDLRIQDLKEKLGEKSDKRPVEKLQEQLKTYASYKDLKELYNKVVP